MTEKEVLKLFKTQKALLDGHFLLSSGLHSPHYLQCAGLLQKPWLAQRLCRALAKKLGDIRADAVIGPALGGVLVSYELGRALGVRSMFAERQDGRLVLRRGFQLRPRERVLVAEDVVTTAKSTREVIEIVRQSRARLAAVASLVDRGQNSQAIFSVPFFSLLKIEIQTYQPEVCPLCRRGKMPLVKPGSR